MKSNKIITKVSMLTLAGSTVLGSGAALYAKTNTTNCVVYTEKCTSTTGCDYTIECVPTTGYTSTIGRLTNVKCMLWKPIRLCKPIRPIRPIRPVKPGCGQGSDNSTNNDTNNDNNINNDTNNDNNVNNDNNTNNDNNVNNDNNTNNDNNVNNDNSTDNDNNVNNDNSTNNDNNIDNNNSTNNDTNNNVGGNDSNGESQETPNVESESTQKSFEDQVLVLVNKERAHYGLRPLTMDESLRNVARVKSSDMSANNYFSHTSPTYGSPFDMLKQFGINYSSAAENIAQGYTTPEAVVNGWMNSSGHRANILNASYTKIGIGYEANGNYWTQLFMG